MSFIARILSGLVLLLSLFAGFVLFVHLEVLPDFPTPKEIVISLQKQESTKGQTSSLSKWSLSRLLLLPWQISSRELVAVMIENHEAARPYQTGLDEAVLIQEFFVEGFISRFLVFFDVQQLPLIIGPVRSLRPYFVQAALPWTKRIIHSGGSPEALERVENHSDILNFNAIYLGDKYFYRKKGVSAPHDLFLQSEKMLSMISEDSENYKYPVSFPLYKVGRALPGSGATVISVNFYNPLHNIHYDFNRVYKRTNGRIVSTATPSNLVFLEMSVEVVGPLGRLAIESVGAGDALFFRSGKVYRGTWHRASEKEPYELLLDSGDPMIFAAGQVWITSLNDLERVTWE